MAAKKISKPANGNGAKRTPTWSLGDMVEIRHSGGMRGRIAEFRGPLGPEGANIYRVRIPRKPKAAYIEVREDQLELISVET